MRVLYIDHPEADFLAALVYWGLCEEIGAASVVDWPFKHTYHGQNYAGPIPYPPPNDHGVCAPFPWMPPQPGAPWDAAEVASRVGEFDLVVLASPRIYGIAALSALIDRVGRGAVRKLVLVDGEDYTAVRWDLVERFAPSVYFKCSCVRDPFEVYVAEKARITSPPRVVPFPLCSPLVDVPASVKELDVVFFGGTNWRPGRREGQAAPASPRAALEERLRREFPSFAGGHLPYAEYIASVARARVAVCVGGSGTEPMRTYETLSCPGTLLARERIDTVTPYPLVEGRTHIGFESADELIVSIRAALSDEPLRARMAAAGNAFLAAHYTPRARARQLLEEAFR